MNSYCFHDHIGTNCASMAKTTGRADLVLTAEEQSSLRVLAAARTTAVRTAQRAKILPGYHAGESFSALSRNG